MTNEELIQQEAERLYPIDWHSNNQSQSFDNNKKYRKAFKAGATFGASLNGWVSVKDSGLPEREKSVIIKCTGHRVATSGYIHERGIGLYQTKTEALTQKMICTV